MKTSFMPVIDADTPQSGASESLEPIKPIEPTNQTTLLHGMHPVAKGLTVAAAAALAACGGGSADTTTPAAPALPPPGTYAYPAPISDQEAARFLLQAQFSASTAQISQLRSTNYNAWLDEQIAARRSTTGWDWLNSRGYDAIDADNQFYNGATRVTT
jgi:hypothetical protein